MWVIIARRFTLIGTSIEEARDAEGKRRTQKRENRIFDILMDSKVSFDELTAWYLSLESVKKLASYDRVKLAINNFNDVFGNKQTIVKYIAPATVIRSETFLIYSAVDFPALIPGIN